ncbi:hypothetical protein ACFLS9_10060 [Bacteroidota bacterium]
MRNIKNNQLDFTGKEVQEERTLLRTHYQLTKDQTRIKNQIKAILGFYGKKIPEELEKSSWSRRYINWLSTEEFETIRGKLSMEIQIERLLTVRKILAKVKHHLVFRVKSSYEILYSLLYPMPRYPF